MPSVIFSLQNLLVIMHLCEYVKYQYEFSFRIKCNVSFKTSHFKKIRPLPNLICEIRNKRYTTRRTKDKNRRKVSHLWLLPEIQHHRGNTLPLITHPIFPPRNPNLHLQTLRLITTTINKSSLLAIHSPQTSHKPQFWQARCSKTK